MNDAHGRGQMEILGLAIIVLLIGMAVLFALSLSGEEEPLLEAQFEQKNLAVKYINTLLSTETSCYDATFRELIQDCAQGGTIFCEGKVSCDFVKDEFKHIEKSILEKRKMRYALKITGPGPVKEISTGLEDCPGERTVGIQYVPAKTGTITVRIELCG